jgi:hypothetical protein
MLRSTIQTKFRQVGQALFVLLAILGLLLSFGFSASTVRAEPTGGGQVCVGCP